MRPQLNIQWSYPKSFDNERTHWIEFQRAQMYLWYFIKGYQIAWRYYRMETDHD